MTDMVIVTMYTVDAFSFLNDGETEQQGVERATLFYTEELELVKSHLQTYGGDYWAGRVEEIQKKLDNGFKVMTFDEFQEAQKKKLITGELKEVTEDQYNEMLNILPPLYWVTINGVEMFCMCEMYTGSFTTQYARVGDKYYCTMVDVTDKNTWIHKLL